MLARIKSLFSKKTAPLPLPAILPADVAEFSRLNLLKAAGQAQRGTDYARAQIFLRGRMESAGIESLKEELRFHPDHSEARALLAALMAKLPQPKADADPEFRELCAAVRPYTMVGLKRLASLHRMAREICAKNVPGSFVECGVAAGGTAALLGAVIARHSQTPRVLFACDTFEGMPDATAADVDAAGLDALASGWGKGTCAAPVDSLREVANVVGAGSVVRPLVGLFSDTLPAHRAEIGPVAFLHMDGDWYSSTRDILVNLYDALSPGALVQVDDYGHWEGCRKAIHDFERERGLKLEIQAVDKHGVWFRKGE